MGPVNAPHTPGAAGSSRVAAEPPDVAARLTVMAELIESERNAEALTQAQAIVMLYPDNAHAYRTAARCAAAIGDPRSIAFSRVADALEAKDGESPNEIWAEFAPETSGEAAPPSPAMPPPADPAPPQPAPDMTEPSGSEESAPPGPGAAVSNGDDPPHSPRAAEDVAPPAAAEPAPERLIIEPDAIERPTRTLDDLVGVEATKSRIAKHVIAPLRRRQRGPRSGVLLFGPPGSGKAFFARAIAGELKARLLPIDMTKSMSWPGDPRENLHHIFETARKAAPCVLFLAEIDRAGVSIGRKDEEIVDRRLLARLTTELTNSAANSGVAVIAGTTAPWDIDVSLRVEGALDRAVLITPPDGPAREAILNHEFRHRGVSGIDVAWVVDRTQHFSGNDLKRLCERALDLAMKDALDGTATVGPGHMTRALREVRSSAPAWFSRLVDHAATGNQGGIYDDALAYVDENRLV